MTATLGSVVPRLETLFRLFSPADDLPTRHDIVPGSAVPPPYHDLLVHEFHMTVTVENFHRELVDVRVLQATRDGDQYARKILLVLKHTLRVVQFGIVRMDLSRCNALVREAIVAERTPLGRVLIENDVLRRIEPTNYLRIEPGPAQMAWFGLVAPRPLYGRLGIIHWNNLPAVELLEIVAPEPPLEGETGPR